MDRRRRLVGVGEQVVDDQLVVAVGVVERHAALVAEPEVDAAPVVHELREQAVGGGRRAAARDGDVGDATLGARVGDHGDDPLGGGAGSGLGVAGDGQLDHQAACPRTVGETSQPIAASFAHAMTRVERSVAFERPQQLQRQRRAERVAARHRELRTAAGQQRRDGREQLVDEPLVQQRAQQQRPALAQHGADAVLGAQVAQRGGVQRTVALLVERGGPAPSPAPTAARSPAACRRSRATRGPGTAGSPAAACRCG